MGQRKKTKARIEPDVAATPLVAPDEQAASPRWFVPVLLVLLLASSLLVYANSFGIDVFHFDSVLMIEQNQAIRMEGDAPVSTLFAHEKRPVVEASLAMNYAMGENAAGGYRFFNALIHGLAGIVLFALVRTLLQKQQAGSWAVMSATWTAFAISLIWIIHPLQTQSVTYVIQRAESMMGLFYLLTLLSVAQSDGSKRPIVWWVVAMIACFLGMGCKGVMVTAPIAVLLMDRCLLAGTLRDAIAQRWPLYGMLIATWIMLLIAGVAANALDATSKGTVGFGSTVSWNHYLMTQPGVLLHYIHLALWPDTLALDYGWPMVTSLSDAIVPGIIVLASLALTVWMLARKPAFGFVLAMFFLVLAPTSSFIPVQDAIFEHRMYLSLASVIFVIVFAGRLFLQRFIEPGMPRLVLATAVLLPIVGALAWKTTQRNLDYADQFTMWTQIAEARPNNGRALFNVGVLHEQQNEVAKSIEWYRKSLEVRPGHWETHYALALQLMRSGSAAAADVQFEKAQTVDPTRVEAFLMHGDYLSRRNKKIAASKIFEAGIATGDGVSAPGKMSKLHFNLGNMYRAMGMKAEAAEQYKLATDVRQDYVKAFFWLGTTCRELGRTDDAIAAFERAIEIDPGHTRARSALIALKASEQPGS